MRVQYSYRSYPNCPAATEYSKTRSENTVRLGGLIGFLGIASGIAYLVFTFQLFGDWNIGDYALSLLFVTGMAYVNFYIFVCRSNNTDCEIKLILLEAEFGEDFRKTHKEVVDEIKYENHKENVIQIKAFSIWYWLVLAAVTSVIALIKSFVIDYGAVVLVLSLISASACGCGFYKLWRKSNPVKKKETPKPEKKEENKENCGENLDEINFCTKCGRKLANDSIFCSGCGAKVRESEENKVELLSPMDFYKEVLSTLHTFAEKEGLCKKGAIVIPELLPIGQKTVLSFLNDQFLNAELKDNPAQFYYVVSSFAYQCGMIFAAEWRDDFSSLDDDFVSQVIADGPWEHVKLLFQEDLGMDQEDFNTLCQKVFEEWIVLHEPYWNLEDPRKYTFNALLAVYQLGVSTILSTGSSPVESKN